MSKKVGRSSSDIVEQPEKPVFHASRGVFPKL